MGAPKPCKPEFIEQAYKLGLLGATDNQFANFFNICTSTLARWRENLPEFDEAIRSGKLKADAEVAHSLYRRAIGYSYSDNHVSSYRGVATLTPIVVNVQPDVAAASLWLRSRQPDIWRERKELSGPDGGAITVKVMQFAGDNSSE